MKTRTKVILGISIIFIIFIFAINNLFEKKAQHTPVKQIETQITSETSTSSTTTTTTHKTTKNTVKTTQKTTKKKTNDKFTKVATASKAEYMAYAKQKGGYNDTQMQCLDWLWEHESSWNPNNYMSDACGIPQSKPCNKIYKQQGSYDWQAQIRWGINYISNRYGGNPCSAWNHYKNSKPHWY